MPEPDGMGEWARISDVFFEPRKAFADIGRRPRWVVPLLLLVLASLVFSVLLGQRIGWDRIVRQSFEASPRVQSLAPEQRAAAEKAIDRQVAVASYMAYAGAVIGGPLMFLTVALVLWGLSSTAGAHLRFKQMWSIVCYAMLPSLVSTLASVAVMFLKNPDDFNVRNPVGFNPGAYMDPASTPRFLHSLMTSLDLFTLWIVALLVIGIATAGHRTSFGKALFVVVLPWLFVVFGKAALSGIF